jgi:hypothetical protein
MSDKAKIFSMCDLSNANSLTLTERKELIKGSMTVLLEEDDRLSNLGMLLSKYEQTIREREAMLRDILECWDEDKCRSRWYKLLVKARGMI